MHDQSSLESGVLTFPTEHVKKETNSIAWHTLNECRPKDMGSRIDQTTLSCHTDSGESIVTGNHATCYMRGSKSLNGRRGARFQLVFENDQPKETQVRLGLFADDDDEHSLSYHRE